MLPLNDTKTSPTRKKYLFDSVYAQTSFSTHYILELIFSTIITTLGLLNNNNVVVIGAMLISPLFWPVMGMALGIITTRQNIMKNAVSSFVVSLIIVLLFSSIISWFVPITEIPFEITSRVNPNIIDLFIAMAISIIGVLGLYYPTISSTATGVAISISLLPPLCIVGIGLSKGLFDLVWKSLLLFGTNIGAIVFMGVIVLYLLKIRPHKHEEEKRFKFGVLISGILMLLLSIPLSLYLKESVRQNAVSTQVRKVMNEEIRNLNKDARVDTVTIDVLSLRRDEPLSVDAKIYLPEGIYMTQSDKEKLLEKLTTAIDRSINLKFNIISTLSLQSDEDAQRSQLRKNIRELVGNELSAYGEEIEIDSVVITFPANINNAPVKILVQIKQYGDQIIGYSDVENLKQKLEVGFGIKTELEIELIPVNRLSEKKLKYGIYEELTYELNSYFSELSSDAKVESITIKGGIVFVEVLLPSEVAITNEIKEKTSNFVKSAVGEDYELQLRISRFEIG